MLHAIGYDSYRLKVLEAGFDILTKRIPASKYEWFVKQQLMINAAIINRFYVTTANVIKEKKLLEEKLKTVTEQANSVSEIDLLQLQLKYIKLKQELIERHEIEKKMKTRRCKYPQPIYYLIIFFFNYY